MSHRSRAVFTLGIVFMKRTATATWVNNPKGGKAAVSTESGALVQSEYFPVGKQRSGINPHELIAAAHAACYSVTLANDLAGAGFCPHRICTTATVTAEKLPAGWTITGIQLDIIAEVPRATQSDFIKVTVSAKTNCTISRLLNTNISMRAKLQSSGTLHKRVKGRACSS
jgi:osmotically inducible protein OsmC